MGNEKSQRVVVLAGPNGAGKSTAAPRLLRGTLGVEEFVNADVIARGLSAFAPEKVAMAAGRLMLSRLRELAGQGLSFAFETTLASRTFAPWLENLIAEGYGVHIFFLWLPDADTAVAPVAERVRTGGHDVPEAVIRRRYAAGLKNFYHRYRHLAETWQVVDNSREESAVLVAAGDRDQSESSAMDQSGSKSANSLATSDLAPDQLAKLIAESRKVEAAVQAAGRDARIIHKRLGQPIVVWKNKHVVWIPPEEIKIPEEPSGE